MLPNPPVMLITDAGQALMPLEHMIEAALRGGCRWVLLRDMHAGQEALLEQAKHIKKICMPFHAKLFISRNIDIAKSVEADGVHLSANQVFIKYEKIKRIGQSCHSLEEMKQAKKNGVDYITLSPVFESASKPGNKFMGIETFKTLVATPLLPVIALGGMTPERAKACLEAGASGIAVMGDLMRSANPENRMREYAALFT